MENYKGIYYNETKEQKYYEGGAHFPYKVLFNILLDLGGVINPDDNMNNYNHSNINMIKVNQLEEKNLIKYKTRNYKQNNMMNMNNPNTLIKYISKNNLYNKENYKNNFISRNDKNKLFNENKFFHKKENTTTYNMSKSKRKNMDNHLLQILLNKKAKEKKNEEKNNDENNNENKYSFLNFYKNTHYRKRSEYSSNIENEKIFKINEHDKLNEMSKNDYKSYIQNKINLIKSYKNNKCLLEINRKKEVQNSNKEIVTRNNNNLSKDIDNSRNKPYLSYYENRSKKSRNIENNNLFEYKNTYENNKNDINDIHIKKNITNNYLFKTSDIDNSKKENENLVNNGFNFNNNIIQKNNKNYIGNDIFKTKNINIKTVNSQLNKNNFSVQQYKKKKINQLCCFNRNNGKSKSGNNIFAKNINKINIVPH
jgi:hypothetical protein